MSVRVKETTKLEISTFNKKFALKPTLLSKKSGFQDEFLYSFEPKRFLYQHYNFPFKALTSSPFAVSPTSTIAEEW